MALEQITPKYECGVCGKVGEQSSAFFVTDLPVCPKCHNKVCDSKKEMLNNVKRNQRPKGMFEEDD